MRGNYPPTSTPSSHALPLPTPRFCVCLANKSTSPFPPTIFHLIHRLRRAEDAQRGCWTILECSHWGYGVQVSPGWGRFWWLPRTTSRPQAWTSPSGPAPHPSRCRPSSSSKNVTHLCATTISINYICALLSPVFQAPTFTPTISVAFYQCCWSIFSEDGSRLFDESGSRSRFLMSKNVKKNHSWKKYKFSWLKIGYRYGIYSWASMKDFQVKIQEKPPALRRDPLAPQNTKSYLHFFASYFCLPGWIQIRSNVL